jgi:hypothetical protein
MVRGQVKNFYSENKELRSGVDPCKVRLTIGFHEYGVAFNLDPGHYGEVCVALRISNAAAGPYVGPFSMLDGPIPQYHHLVIPAVPLSYLPYQRNHHSQLIYGPGGVVDCRNLLASQAFYDLAIRAALSAGMHSISHYDVYKMRNHTRSLRIDAATALTRVPCSASLEVNYHDSDDDDNAPSVDWETA